ncbi:transporter associated domain-containing protein [Natrinema gelatinilyticum]|uniref:transporter associated domain-containing protein n=1 Tax=Natrinema gelatinilyticum TaxID=2961571 RepID=UPI003CE51B09
MGGHSNRQFRAIGCRRGRTLQTDTTSDAGNAQKRCPQDVYGAYPTTEVVGFAPVQHYNIVGTADIHELIAAYRDGSAEDTPLSDLELLNPPHHVPESKRVDELLSEMQASRTRMAVVIDEFGTTEGLVTVEDLAEEIVGEILEGTEDAPITQLNKTTALVRGDVDIATVNERLGLNLPDGEEFETIVGLLFNRAGRLVEQGETFDVDDVQLRAETIDQTRIKQVRIRTDHTDQSKAPSESAVEAESPDSNEIPAGE